MPTPTSKPIPDSEQGTNDKLCTDSDRSLMVDQHSPPIRDMRGTPRPSATKAKPCVPYRDADLLELADAKVTLDRSKNIALSLLSAKGSHLAYWFAELYYYITMYEFQGTSLFEHPSFVLHFIPIFYDMYAQNAQYFSRGELQRIKPSWKGHFAVASTPDIDSSNPELYLAYVTSSLVSGVSAHINGDMATALEQAYRTYVAKYCLSVPFDSFKRDFFEKNRPIFDKVRVSFIEELMNLGLGLGPMGRPVDPNLATKVADIFGGPLKVNDIYAWREDAWQQAKSKIEGEVHGGQ